MVNLSGRRELNEHTGSVEDRMTSPHR